MDPKTRVDAPLSLVYVGDLPPYLSGGAAVVAAHLVTGLAERGHRVRALSASTDDVLPGADDLAFGQRGVTVSRYLLPAARPALSGDPGIRRLEGDQIDRLLPAVIAETRPDVVVSGQESVVWRAGPVVRAHGLPCVQIVHGTGAAFLALLESDGADPTAGELLERLRSMDLLVTVARHLAEHLVRLGLSPVRVIPNPVDLERFHPGEADGALRHTLALSGYDVVVAHVSTLRDVKRPLDVVASAELALRRNPDLVYLIVGDGPGRPAMEEACRAKGVDRRFRFVGLVEHARVAAYLRLADIVLMPSAREGQTLAGLETQATGRALVASDIPASREIVADGQTGLLVALGDAEALAAATLRLAGDPVLRGRIGRLARESAEAHGVKRFIDRYEAALKALPG